MDSQTKRAEVPVPDPAEAHEQRGTGQLLDERDLLRGSPGGSGLAQQAPKCIRDPQLSVAR